VGDQVSAIVATIALVASLYALVETRKKDRRDSFLKLHEQLIGDDAQRGRALLMKLGPSPNRLSEEDFRCIKRALARYDLLGMYVARGYVRLDDALTLWAEPLYFALRASPNFIAYTEKTDGYRPWGGFLELATQAEKQLRLRNSPVIARTQE